MDGRPVLVLTTSMHMDCFLLCVKCLELYTHLKRFKTVYVLAEDVIDEHAVIIKSFQKRHANVIDVHVTSRDTISGASAMFNFILRRHAEDVIVKLDENVFVTPRWLEHLLGAYKIHKQHKDVAAVSCLSPISRVGRQCMDRVLRLHYSEERKRLPDMPVEKNAVYQRFLWEKILYDKLIEKYFELEKPRHHYTAFVNTHCIMFDGRLTSCLSPTAFSSASIRDSDEDIINEAMRDNGLKAAVVADAMAHHYCHKEVEKFLRSHISLDDVWWYMTCLDESPAYLKTKSRGVIAFPRDIDPRPYDGSPRLL
jgi:hypothetical protein